MNISVFRKDRKNVGDWWSPPFRYFPLRGSESFDFAKPDQIPNQPGIVVLGGGGLGRDSFIPFMNSLLRPDRKYKIIAWGVGADSITRKGGLVSRPEDISELTAYFKDLDDVGTRIYDLKTFQRHTNFRWVPCASCLHSEIPNLRKEKIVHCVGVYEHLREPLLPHLQVKSRMLSQIMGHYRFCSNRGTDIVSKLRFIAQCEFLVTNSYHGVYWATLLGRRAICVPFKDGLYSFRHQPTYWIDGDINGAMERSISHPEAFDECRQANINFYRDMVYKYGDL